MKLWLDLELREDVDDFFTLVYALENKLPVSVVSINKPSIKELSLLNHVFSFFDVSIPVFVSGFITDYPNDKDLASFTETLIPEYIPIEYNRIETITPENFDIRDTIVFCGGSLTTLSYLTENFDCSTFKAVIQGGFASYKVVGKENTLKKFKNREKVPSWNMNLDLDSTIKVINSDLNKTFVSKNICHDSWVDKKDVKGLDTIFGRWMFEFLDNNFKPNKCMHDLLAFLTIFDKELVEFVPVKLCYDNSEKRTKWWSEINTNSNSVISTSYNKDRFYSLLIGSPNCI